MRNLLVGNPIIATMALFSVAIVTFFVWGVSNVVSDAEERADGILNIVTDIIEDARSFVYVYDPVDLEINVTDDKVEDWEKVHSRALQQGGLVEQTKNGQSWLEDNFTDGKAVTPYLVRTPRDFSNTESRSPTESGKLSDFSEVVPEKWTVC